MITTVEIGTLRTVVMLIGSRTAMSLPADLALHLSATYASHPWIAAQRYMQTRQRWVVAGLMDMEASITLRTVLRRGCPSLGCLKPGYRTRGSHVNGTLPPHMKSVPENEKELLGRAANPFPLLLRSWQVPLQELQLRSVLPTCSKTARGNENVSRIVIANVSVSANEKGSRESENLRKSVSNVKNGTNVIVGVVVRMNESDVQTGAKTFLTSVKIARLKNVCHLLPLPTLPKSPIASLGSVRTKTMKTAKGVRGGHERHLHLKVVAMNDLDTTSMVRVVEVVNVGQNRVPRKPPLILTRNIEDAFSRKPNGAEVAGTGIGIATLTVSVDDEERKGRGPASVHVTPNPTSPSHPIHVMMSVPQASWIKTLYKNPMLWLITTHRARLCKS